jgi:hypothetical protein
LLGHWEFDDKMTLFHRAIEWPAQMNYELKQQAAVLVWMLDRWPQFGEQQNVFGLSQQDRDDIRMLIQTGSNAATFLPWLGKIRMATTYRIVGWPNQRASCLATNVNHAGKPSTYGVLYTFDPTPTLTKATFLFPWTDAKWSGVFGSCVLEPGRMRANNLSSVPGKPRGAEVAMPLDTSQPLFHLVVSSANDPYLDTAPPSTWPPLEPKSLSLNPTPEFGEEISWVSGGIPEGGVTDGWNEGWDWTNTDAEPYSDAPYRHQSALINNDVHQHYFTGATETLIPAAGDSLYAYIRLDPTNPPSEVMLQWFEPQTGWEHRAYWGANQIGFGVSGMPSRRYMGPLPEPTGVWQRLEVPARFVGLEGRTITGMAFTLFGGQATWDEAGKRVFGLSKNLAVGKPTTQSSTLFSAGPWRAADDNPIGEFGDVSVTHTDFNNQAWWQVDLGSSYSLDLINIWNRTDCCLERLSDFYVLVSDVPFNSTDLITTTNQSGVSNYHITNAQISTQIQIGRSGRYVRVQLTGSNYLSLAEVEVYGQPLSPPTPRTGSISASPNPVKVCDGSGVEVHVGSPTGALLAQTGPSGTKTTGQSVANGTVFYLQDVSGGLSLTTGNTLATVSVGVTSAGCATASPADDTVWVEDAIPAGATPSNDWNWIMSNPSRFSRFMAHQ